MKVVIQRVSQASVSVDGHKVASIGPGLLLLVGIHAEDAESNLNPMVAKIINLRIFEDAQSRMNFSVLDTGGEILAVSQFTLLADCRKGRRPNFMQAAPAEKARRLFDLFVEILESESRGIAVKTGVFQAHMDVQLSNDGPVTIVIDSHDLG